jgi:hypothetical protein
VPGITVDLKRIILSTDAEYTSISFKASSTISRLIVPSLLDGVGTDKNIISLPTTTSCKV